MVEHDLAGSGWTCVARSEHETRQDEAAVHVGMRPEEVVDGAVRQDLARIIVVRILDPPRHRLVDQAAARAVQHGDRRGMYEATDSAGMGGGEQGRGRRDIGCDQSVTMAPALIAVAKIGCGVEEHVVPAESVGEGGDVAHVCLDHCHVEIAEHPRCLVAGAHQRRDAHAALSKQPHEIVAEQPCRPGDECAGECHGVLIRSRIGIPIGL